MKSKRTYKIIACVSIWLSVIIAFFSFAIAKTKAGVIVNEGFSVYDFGVSAAERTWNYQDIKNKYIGISDYFNQRQFELRYTRASNNANFSVYYQINNIDQSIVSNIFYFKTNSPSNIVLKSTRGYFQTINGITYAFVNLKEYVDYIKSELDRIYSDTFTFNNTVFATTTINDLGLVYATIGVSIAPCENIYDLKQNDVALIYLSDISGLNSAAYRDEITINWGYIDSNDNTQFTVHAPTVQAQKTDNNIISLAMPVNAAGDATSYYSIDQSAILSTISSGGATATAHIYGIYVWIQQSRIQWGLADFDTSGLPASGASMNYITSLTSLYDFTANNTSTMTCRLSISNNFNFITIKNQPILSAYNINTVIQQGGFLPAWAVYNWARGSSAGYTSGEQAGAAPYQPGGAGYQEIFEAGKQAGIAENIGTVNWFVSAFQAVDAMLNIRIFPNITIGYLVGIPFVISVVWFIIRMFRGGGSSS